MRKHIAFLHTSSVHVETFDRLVKALNTQVQLEHIVAEDLLAEAQRVGADDPVLVKRIQAVVAGAAANGAAIVVCTCSTIGGAAERTQPAADYAVARIDRAMADRAVELGPRILMVAALESTLEPTAQLIQESATAQQTDVELTQLLVPDAWEHFQRGDREAYIGAVVAAVRAQTRPVDVVVLAQASMSSAAEALIDMEFAVLASPALGVHRVLAYLNAHPQPIAPRISA